MLAAMRLARVDSPFVLSGRPPCPTATRPTLEDVPRCATGKQPIRVAELKVCLMKLKRMGDAEGEPVDPQHRQSATPGNKTVMTSDVKLWASAWGVGRGFLVCRPKQCDAEHVNCERLQDSSPV